MFYGADMDVQNASGNTPLHICAVNNMVSESCKINEPEHGKICKMMDAQWRLGSATHNSLIRVFAWIAKGPLFLHVDSNESDHTVQSFLYACYMSPVTRKPVFGVCDQVRLKPACSATEASWSLEILAIASRGIILSRQPTTKVLIRLRQCSDWSALLLFAYGINWFSHDVAHFVGLVIIM